MVRAQSLLFTAAVFFLWFQHDAVGGKETFGVIRVQGFGGLDGKVSWLSRKNVNVSTSRSPLPCTSLPPCFSLIHQTSAC